MNQNEQVDTGGVMRCCLSSLEDMLLIMNDMKAEAKDGQISTCIHCKTRLIRKNNVWQWEKLKP